MKKNNLICCALAGLLIAGCFGLERCAAAAAPDGPAIVHVGPIAPDLIGLTVRAGRVQHGRQQPYRYQVGDLKRIDNEGNTRLVRLGSIAGYLVGPRQDILTTMDRFVGKQLDTALADRSQTYTLTSSDDTTFAAGVRPVRVFRKSKPIDMPRAGEKPVMPVEHTLYLQLPSGLKPGAHYSISFAGLGLSAYSFCYAPDRMRSEAVHVSQIGFRPDDPLKVAYVSLWMGSGGPRDFPDAAICRVLDDATGEPVYTGALALVKPSYRNDEDAYKKNYNGTGVYRFDFSAATKPGTYRVYVEGVGCSYPFAVAETAWRDAFAVAARGFYHQRSGIELGPPYTPFKRPRCFHPDDGVEVRAANALLIETGNGPYAAEDTFQQLARSRTNEMVSGAWGGYCDAGDWDRRIQHLDIARLLLELADMFPEYYSTLNLNIPESTDALPDIVNEALWGIDFFRRLQTPEGGVRGGIESLEHPKRGEASWQETWEIMAYAPGLWSSYQYAATAARAAWWLRSRDRARAAGYAESAVRAMQWAEQHLKMRPLKRFQNEIRDARNLAAAELFRLLGKKEWHRLFLRTTVFTKPGLPVYKYQKHSQGDAAWVYCNTPRRGLDEAVKANCRSAIILSADNRLASQRNAGYGWAKDPWLPPGPGVFTRPDCIDVVRAHALTGEERYLQAIVLACQTGAGANPSNMCYTTGLGQKWPRNVLHIDSRVTGQPPPPGLTVCGPLGFSFHGGEQNPYLKLFDPYCYPPLLQWPVIENYLDVCWFPGMCEYTVHQLMAPNAYVWGYLAARPRK